MKTAHPSQIRDLGCFRRILEQFDLVAGGRLLNGYAVSNILEICQVSNILEAVEFRWLSRVSRLFPQTLLRWPAFSRNANRWQWGWYA